MKKLFTSLVALSVATFAYGQTDFVAAWTFSSYNGFTSLDFDGNDFINGDFASDDVFAADYAGSGDISGFLDFTDFSSGVVSIASLGTNAIDAVDGLTSINGDSFVGIVAAVDNEKSLAFSADFSHFSDAVLTMAATAQNGEGILDFSTGDSFAIGGAESLVTVDLSALAGNANGTFNLQFSDLAGTENLVFDNIQITGSVVPEPSTYAAIVGVLSLGFVAYRRRK